MEKNHWVDLLVYVIFRLPIKNFYLLMLSNSFRKLLAEGRWWKTFGIVMNGLIDFYFFSLIGKCSHRKPMVCDYDYDYLILSFSSEHNGFLQLPNNYSPHHIYSNDENGMTGSNWKLIKIVEPASWLSFVQSSSFVQ